MRCAISPDAMKASPICVTRLLQLMVKPSADAASAVQTMSSLGPLEFQFQRACMISAKPSVWSECICVKKIASSCPTSTLTCESRNAVPRPASNCNDMVLQSLLSSPYRIRVPAPATPLRSTGPLIVPVSVTSRQGPDCAEEKAVNQMVVAKNTVARQERCIAIAPKIVLLEIAEIWS